MPVPRLPPETFKRHFPNSGNGNNPIIESDGDCLIFRRALKIKGKSYDIRIWRLDSNDSPIRLKKDEGFLKEVMVEVQKLATELFKGGENFQDPTDIRMWYSDKDPSKKTCYSERMSLPWDNDDKFTHITEDKFSPAIPKTMEQIHHLFFHGITTVLTTEENHTLFPKMVRREDEVSENEEVKVSAPTKKGEPSEFPKNVVINLPPPLVDAATGSDATKATTEGQQHVTTLRKELKDASGAYEGTGFLKGITYAALEDYARTGVGEVAKLGPAYNVYKAVLKNPEAPSTDNDEMRKWLKDCYLIAYKQYQKLQAIYDKDADKRGRSFDDWCKYYSAKAIAGFIRVDQEPIDKLVEWLIATPTPTADPKPKRKTWSFWNPFASS